MSSVNDPRQAPDHDTSGLPTQIATAVESINSALQAVPIGIRMKPALLAADTLNCLCSLMRQLTNVGAVSVNWRTTGSNVSKLPMSGVLYYGTPTNSTAITPRPKSVQYYACDHVALRDDHMRVNDSIQSAVDTLWFFLVSNQPVSAVLPALELHWQMVRHLQVATP